MISNDQHSCPASCSVAVSGIPATDIYTNCLYTGVDFTSDTGWEGA